MKTLFRGRFNSVVDGFTEVMITAIAKIQLKARILQGKVYVISLVLLVYLLFFLLEKKEAGGCLVSVLYWCFAFISIS